MRVKQLSAAARMLALLGGLLALGATAEPKREHPKKPHAGRYLPPGDPNLNPSWDWTVSGAGHTLYYSVSGASPVQLNNVQLPFFTTGHPLNTDQKDMYREDGWMLVYRDFGTPTDAPPMPFFALYNKYRGTLRVMFYNAPNVAYTYYRVDLSFRSTTYTGALLTFTDAQKATIADYDKAKSEHFMGRVAQFRGWAYADFTLFGFDPNLSPDAKLRLDIWGIDQSQVQLNSTQFTLSEVVDNASPSGSKGVTLSNVKDAFNQGQKYYKDVVNVKKSLQDAVTKTGNNNPWWKGPVQTLLGTSLATVAPYIGGLVGFVSSFIGGKSTPAPREPLNFTGSLQMEGTITNTLPIVSTDLALATGPTAPDFYRPVQFIPWGLFNLTTKPVMRTLVWRDECVDDYGQLRYCERDYEYRLAPLSYVFNTNAGVTLKSVKTAFTYYNAAPSAFTTQDQLGGAYYERTEYCYYNQPCYTYTYGNWPNAVALELVLQVNSPTRYSDQEIVVYKVFPADSTWEYQY